MNVTLPGQPAATAPAVEIEGLSKHFGDVHALRGIGATIQPGRLTGLVGADGAGKTTLMRIMAGLMTPDEGSVTVAGFDTRKDSEAIHAVTGYMPQRFGLYEDLSVMQNMQLYAALRGMDPTSHGETFDRLLEFTRLRPFTTRLAGQLSGGMKQKLGLACALMATPKVLLLDEPGVGVDPISRRELWAMVGDLTDQGIGVLWSTAYLDEAEKCDTVYLLNEGKLLFDGLPADLTGAVADRVFRVTGFKERRREFLTHALDRDDVIDGTIQGRSVRLLMKDDVPAPTPQSLEAEGAKVEPAPARFEDGFIERLGGGPSG